MRKLLLTFIFCLFTCGAFAQMWRASAQYSTAKNFDKVTAQLERRLSLNLSAALQAKTSREKGQKDPSYALLLPLSWEDELFQFYFTPFYYFKNASKESFLNNLNQTVPFVDSYAFGARAHLVMTLQEDTVNDLYTHAYIGAAFARQQGTLLAKDKTFANQYYSQAAYTLGMHQNFFRAYSFEAAANVFQYPDGISHVNTFYSVMDQQDLAFTETFAITHDLPKYALQARFTRMWPEKMASFYLGYRFGEFYTSDPQHSILIGNTFALTQSIGMDIAYNHLRSTHNDNKLDVFHAQLHINF